MVYHAVITTDYPEMDEERKTLCLLTPKEFDKYISILNNGLPLLANDFLIRNSKRRNRLYNIHSILIDK